MKRGNNMFSNIGGKIKAWAVIVAWIGIIGSIIGGIVMINSGAQMSRYSNPMVFPGILLMVIGSLGAWVSSFVLYGFGQLIEHTASIDSKLQDVSVNPWKKEENETGNSDKVAVEKKLVNETKSAQISSIDTKTAKVDRTQEYTTCPFCSTPQDSDRNVCIKCGAKFIDG